MAGSVFLDDFQQKHLVVGDRKLGQREYRPLTLVPPYNCRIVAYAQDFERCLLCRTLGEFAIRYDEPPRIHLEGDVRVVRDAGVNVYHVIEHVNPQHFDFNAVLLRTNALHVRTVLAVYVAQHAFYGCGLFAAYFAQQHQAFGCWGRRQQPVSSYFLVAVPAL